jgi:NAD-dependent SIR2 family protein deacetylase
MTKFLSCLGTADRMQSEFVGYVVEACCQEDPSTTHTLTLMLLHALTAGKPHHGLVAFTTNYDNLLERAYLRFLRKTSVYGRSSSRIRIDVGHMTSLAITRPTYTLRPTDVRRVVPVFPIHGCISLCRCPRCGRLLQTEAAALGQKMCVYCGCEIPPLVVPFREGGADKNVLSLLESEVGKADLCIFIGSSFGDPHILERIRRGLDHGQRRARLLNFCNAPIPADLANAKAGRDLDIQGDIHLGLVRFLDAYMEVADPETAVWINRAYSEAL